MLQTNNLLFTVKFQAQTYYTILRLTLGSKTNWSKSARPISKRKLLLTLRPKNSSNYKASNIKFMMMRLSVWFAVVLSMKRKEIRLLSVQAVTCLSIRNVMEFLKCQETTGFAISVWNANSMESMFLALTVLAMEVLCDSKIPTKLRICQLIKVNQLD